MGGAHKVSNANFPLDELGATYHVGCKRGDVANRIVTVGDPARAIALATLLDGGDDIDANNHKQFLNFRSPLIQIKTSSRLFTTVTGRYKGVPVSIIAIGMGVPMMDFMVREVRAIVDGPLVVIRFGSCGSIGSARAGDVVLATHSQMCSRNVDYWITRPIDAPAAMSKEDFVAAMQSESGGPYRLSQPVEADEYVAAALRKALNTHVPEGTQVVAGLDTTADSFYSSQGRVDPAFDDANAHLIDYICQERKEAECLQMETFGLYHLARTARPLPDGTPSIRTAACAMVFAARRYNSWIDPAVQVSIQAACSRAVLDAVVAVELDEKQLHPEADSCWANQ